MVLFLGVNSEYTTQLNLAEVVNTTGKPEFCQIKICETLINYLLEATLKLFLLLVIFYFEHYILLLLLGYGRKLLI